MGMIPARFDYRQAGSVAEALQLLASCDDAKLLAGGHSLVPLMKMRLVSPSTLIDISGIAELQGVTDTGSVLRVGALTRHRVVERSQVVAQHVPLLAHVAGLVGDPQVRNRGTIGGSLVHGDPAADLPSVALATGATMVVTGAAGERRIAAADFFVDFLETAVGPDEILTAIEFPKRTGAGFGYEKFVRRSMDYAIVGVAVQAGDQPGIALVNMGSVPRRADAASQALAGGAGVDAVAALAAEGTNPPEDLNANADYRRHLASVLTKRALLAAGYR